MSNSTKTGLGPLRAEFAKLARDIRRAAAQGVADAARLLEGTVRRNAPVDTGALRDSIHVERGGRSRARVQDMVVVEGGHGDEPVALDVEYGTQDQAPDPFIRRSVARERSRVRAAISAPIVRRIAGG